MTLWKTSYINKKFTYLNKKRAISSSFADLTQHDEYGRMDVIKGVIT